MAMFDRTRLTTDDLHHRTAALAQAATEAGDDFLKYLYVMALQHIEETYELDDKPRSGKPYLTVLT